jgi:hypothetical protein
MLQEFADQISLQVQGQRHRRTPPKPSVVTSKEPLWADLSALQQPSGPPLPLFPREGRGAFIFLAGSLGAHPKKSAPIVDLEARGVDNELEA